MGRIVTVSSTHVAHVTVAFFLLLFAGLALIEELGVERGGSCDGVGATVVVEGVFDLRMEHVVRLNGKVFDPTAFCNGAVRMSESSDSVLLPLHVLAFELGSEKRDIFAFSVLEIVLPEPLEEVSVLIILDSFTVEVVSPPLAHILGSVRPDVDAEARTFAVVPFSVVCGASRPHISSLSIDSIVLPFALVRSAVGPFFDAESVRHRLQIASRVETTRVGCHRQHSPFSFPSSFVPLPGVQVFSSIDSDGVSVEEAVLPGSYGEVFGERC